MLTLPPLRERKQDIAPAAIWMGNRILRAAGLGLELVTSDELGRLSPTESARAVELRRDAVAALEEHEWHGNLRELETVLERALLLYREGNVLDGKAVARGALGAFPPARRSVSRELRPLCRSELMAELGTL